MPKCSLTLKSCSPAAAQVDLTSQSGCSLFLLKNLLFLQGGQILSGNKAPLHTHSCMRSYQGRGCSTHRVQGAWATTGLVCAGKSASFHAAEPRAKQNSDYHDFQTYPGHMLWQDSVSLTQLLSLGVRKKETEAEQAKKSPKSLRKQQQGPWSCTMSWSHTATSSGCFKIPPATRQGTQL